MRWRGVVWGMALGCFVAGSAFTTDCYISVTDTVGEISPFNRFPTEDIIVSARFRISPSDLYRAPQDDDELTRQYEMTLLTYGTEKRADEFLFGIGTNGRLGGEIKNSYWRSDPTTAIDGQWHVATVQWHSETYDQNGDREDYGILIVYLDGIEIARVQTKQGRLGTKGCFMIGQESDGRCKPDDGGFSHYDSRERFVGDLQEVAIWEREEAFTTEEWNCILYDTCDVLDGLVDKWKGPTNQQAQVPATAMHSCVTGNPDLAFGRTLPTAHCVAPSDSPTRTSTRTPSRSETRSRTRTPTASRSHSSTPSPSPGLPPTDCGPSGLDRSCPAGQCCSASGWCGSTVSHCSSGCQRAFGDCVSATPSPSDTPAPSTTRSITRTPAPSVAPSVSLTPSTTPSKPAAPLTECGPTGGGASCPTGECCSAWGWCGSETDHCGEGCQSAYGHCEGAGSASSTPVPSPLADTAECGLHGGSRKCAEYECCSQYGYCGVTLDHCGLGCQPLFGLCSSDASPSVTPAVSPSPAVIPSALSNDDDCGKTGGNQVCTDNQCCSEYGYCGTEVGHCGVGCQPYFGRCDELPTPSTSVTSAPSPTPSTSPAAAAPSPSSTPAAPSPSSSPPPTYVYYTGVWSTCSKACNGGTRSRAVVCTSGHGTAVADTFCSGIKPLESETCNTETCPSGLYWDATEVWGDCTHACDDGTGSTLGTATRPRAKCRLDMSEVNPQLCADAGLTEPVTVKTCNRFPCASTVAVWITGSWGDCESEHLCGSGTRSRTVVCVDTSGAVQHDSACTSAGSKPSSTDVCGVLCTCATATDCPFVHGTCVANQCQCKDGWGGPQCDVVITPSDACIGGVLDIEGTCCYGAVDAESRVCCGDGVDTDSNGRCCPADDDVDSCGVCGGSCVVVDVRGEFCEGPLPPSGLCCPEMVDSCGVCGGNHACGASVSVDVRLKIGVAPTATELHGVLATVLQLSMDLIHDVSLNVHGGVRLLQASASGSEVDLCATQGACGPTGELSFTVKAAARLSTSAIMALLSKSTEFDSWLAFQTSSMALSRMPQCGNTLCEHGEDCEAGDDCPAGCPEDCPLSVMTCPVGGSSSGLSSDAEPCSGHGTCIMSSGTCECTPGYSGVACDRCSVDHIRVAGSEVCAPLALAMQSCADGVQNFREEGVDCGGLDCAACTEPSSSGPVMSPGVILAIVAAVAVVGVVGSTVLGRWYKKRLAANAEEKEFGGTAKGPAGAKGKKLKQIFPAVQDSARTIHVAPSKRNVLGGVDQDMAASPMAGMARSRPGSAMSAASTATHRTMGSRAETPGIHVHSAIHQAVRDLNATPSGGSHLRTASSFSQQRPPSAVSFAFSQAEPRPGSRGSAAGTPQHQQGGHPQHRHNPHQRRASYELM